MAYGGRVFNQVPELRQSIPAHFLGESIQAAIQNVETLLTANVLLEGVVPVSEKDIKLGQSFIRNQPMIDMYVLADTQKNGIPIQFSSIAVQELGNNLASAISLGKIEALSAEMEWITGLLHAHGQNVESLDSFFSAYAKSIDTAMGKEETLK